MANVVHEYEVYYARYRFLHEAINMFLEIDGSKQKEITESHKFWISDSHEMAKAFSPMSAQFAEDLLMRLTPNERRSIVFTFTAQERLEAKILLRVRFGKRDAEWLKAFLDDLYEVYKYAQPIPVKR